MERISDGYKIAIPNLNNKNKKVFVSLMPKPNNEPSRLTTLTPADIRGENFFKLYKYKINK